MNKKFEINESLLIKLYINDGISARNIAKDIGCCVSNVFYYLKKYNISKKEWKFILNKELLEDLYITKYMSSYEIGKLLGCSFKTVVRCLKHNSILIRKGVDRDNKIKHTMKKYNRTGRNNPNWKHGIFCKDNNSRYVRLYNSNHPYSNKSGYIFEHRLVMEKNLVRYLKPEEVVHHINLNTKDNRIENLMLFKNNSEHRKFHNNLNLEKC